MELRIDGERPVVVRTLRGGPAALAGVESGDVIMAIDAADTKGVGLGEAVVRLRGMPDTQVSVTVDRKGKRIVFVVLRKPMRRVDDDYEATKPSTRSKKQRDER